MPKRGIDYCNEIMEELKDNGFEKEAPVAEILKAIKRVAGLSNIVRLKYLRALQDFEYIEKKGEGVFKLHHDKVST